MTNTTAGDGFVRGERARDVDPVEAGHGDVEQQHVGLQRFGQADRAIAVAGGADQLRAVGPGEQQLQPLGGERLVVGDQDPAAAWPQPFVSTGMVSATLIAAAGRSGRTGTRAAAEARLEPLADVGEAEAGAFVGRRRQLVLAAVLQPVADLEDHPAVVEAGAPRSG